MEVPGPKSEVRSHVDPMNHRLATTWDLGLGTWDCSTCRSAAQFEQLVLLLLRVLPGFEAGRGAAQNHGRVFEPRAHDGGVAGVVARRAVLLVSVLVFFIDDDQAEIFHRRKQRAARPDDHARRAIFDARPGLAAFGVGHAGMQKRDVGESMRKAPHGLRRERDFRNEHNGALAVFDSARNRADVDLGLTASCDSKEQERFELVAIDAVRVRRPARVVARP